MNWGLFKPFPEVASNGVGALLGGRTDIAAMERAVVWGFLPYYRRIGRARDSAQGCGILQEILERSDDDPLGQGVDSPGYG